jgi:hypothetical protein
MISWVRFFDLWFLIQPERFTGALLLLHWGMVHSVSREWLADRAWLKPEAFGP